MRDLFDAEAWENALDDAWPDGAERAAVVRVLAREVTLVLERQSRLLRWMA